jgi:hypothetical protein
LRPYSLRYAPWRACRRGSTNAGDRLIHSKNNNTSDSGFQQGIVEKIESARPIVPLMLRGIDVEKIRPGVR